MQNAPMMKPRRSGSVPLVATGYGRKLVRQAARSVTEITCHAKGVYRELGTAERWWTLAGRIAKSSASARKAT